MKATYTVNPSNVFDLLMSQVNLNVDINPREDGLDKEHIKALMSDTPDTYPPIQIATTDNGVSFIIVDGYHRFYAAKAQNATKMHATMVNFTLNEYDKEHPEKIPTALWLAAYNANVAHGKTLTLDERKKYALELYLNDESLSWLQLAKLTKLSDKTVKSYIEKQLNDVDKENDDNETATYKAQLTNAAKLVKALRTFYTNEHTLLSSFGTPNKPRDVKERAKALYLHIASLPHEKHAEIVQELSSLNETLSAFKELLQQSKAKAK